MFPFFLGLLLHQAVIPKAAGCELKLSHPAATIFSSGNFTSMKPYLPQMGVPHVSIFQAPSIDDEYLKLYNQCSLNPKDRCLHTVSPFLLCNSTVTNPINPSLDLFSVTFDVAVYNHVAVQVGDPLEDLPGVSPSHLLCEGSVGFQLVLYGTLEHLQRQLM